VPELAGPHLDVYDTRDGTWTPDPRDIVIPDGWKFLPAGHSLITRTGEAAGRYGGFSR
jgi:hypothetical protein